jgi:hypothetical protein
MNQTLVATCNNVAIPYGLIVLVVLVELPPKYKLTLAAGVSAILPTPFNTTVIVVPNGNATLALVGMVSVCAVAEVLYK